MAGHALRYDRQWYYRAVDGTWSLAAPGAVRAGREVPVGQRRPVDTETAVVLEQLWQDVTSGRLYARVARGLVLTVPPTADALSEALERRPDEPGRPS